MLDSVDRQHSTKGCKNSARRGRLHFSYMAKQGRTDKGIQKAQGIHNPPCKRLFTLKEAADYLGRSVWGMRELIWSGKIPVVKDPNGRKIFLDVVDLESYVNHNKITYH